jgi:hypothetical protein
MSTRSQVRLLVVQLPTKISKSRETNLGSPASSSMVAADDDELNLLYLQ